jgi:hypothetical protein
MPKYRNMAPALAALLCWGCAASTSRHGSPPPQPRAALRTNGADTAQAKLLPCLPNLPNFGQPGAGVIRVPVCPEVKRPGVYFLPKGSVVGDAIKAAQGLTDFANWKFSSLIRTQNGTEVDRVRFHKGKERVEDEQSPLYDGDVV